MCCPVLLFPFLQTYDHHSAEKISALKKDSRRQLFVDDKLTAEGYQKTFGNFKMQFVTSYPPPGQGLGDGSNPDHPDHGKLRTALRARS